MQQFDLIVIGAGPGGYVCAIRAAQLGLSVAIVEKRAADAKKGPSLGGTCLNVGCIPSKALLDSSERFHDAGHALAAHGIKVGKPKLDLATMLKRKDKVVSDLTGGIGMLMKKNKITVLAGTGTVVNGDTAAVTDAAGERTEYGAESIVLAAGSVPIELPFMPFDHERIVSSDQAINFPEVPNKLVVVGGGVIGLELGQVWARLGAEVTVVEFLDRIAPGFDLDVTKQLQRSLSKLGITFQLSTKVTGATVTKTGVTVATEDSAGTALSLEADRVLVAVGRRPCSETLGLEAAGVALTAKGRVQVDHDFQTNVPGVYAIGDLIDGPMLAHKAEEDGVALAEKLAGKPGHVDYDLIPGVVYTHPELATIGLGIDAAKERGIAVKTGSFSFMANGRAKAADDTTGLVRIVADATTDKLLGCTILGPRASDLIMEAGTIMAFGGSAEDLALICHAHPTFSEAVKEAALDSQGRVIHS
ncbi:MAG: dihydrolipoyl dehydrogenase [Planctomycetota bacterium]|jgi:dihydrolipoamide dehydrogenase|nr:dihydrolipoyl dehydrogenase [Planctomycetota bacterium]